MEVYVVFEEHYIDFGEYQECNDTIDGIFDSEDKAIHHIQNAIQEILSCVNDESPYLKYYTFSEVPSEDSIEEDEDICYYDDGMESSSYYYEKHIVQ